MGYIAFAKNEEVFIFGEEWALNNDKTFKGKGWYYAIQKSTFADKGGKKRKVIILSEKIDNMELVHDILNVYYGTETGIKLICGKYAKYLPKDIINDFRFESLNKLSELIGLTVNTCKDDGMKSFIVKISDTILSEICKEKKNG